MVAPELAVPGKTTAVLITLHGPASLQPLNVTLRLIPDQGLENGQIPVETTLEIKGECLKFVRFAINLMDLLFRYAGNDKYNTMLEYIHARGWCLEFQMYEIDI